MKIVRVKKEPVQFRGNLCPDSRFPGTGYAHENNSLKIVVGHTCRPWRGLPFDTVGTAELPTESNILFDFGHGRPAHEHQQHPVAPLKFHVPSIHFPEGVLDIGRAKRVFVDYEYVQ